MNNGQHKIICVRQSKLNILLGISTQIEQNAICYAMP